LRFYTLAFSPTSKILKDIQSTIWLSFYDYIIRQPLRQGLRRLDPKEFQSSFVNWTRHLATVFEGVIAIDGQTHRGARDTGQNKSPLHMVSAFATDLRLVLAQVKANEKSNEITAIPEVLELLELKGGAS
jgi:hypothetical protein